MNRSGLHNKFLEKIYGSKQISLHNYQRNLFLIAAGKQGFGREKDVNRGKFTGSILVIFCCKELGKFASCAYILANGKPR